MALIAIPYNNSIIVSVCVFCDYLIFLKSKEFHWSNFEWRSPCSQTFHLSIKLSDRPEINSERPEKLFKRE